MHLAGAYRRFLQRWRKHIDGVVLLVGCPAAVNRSHQREVLRCAGMPSKFPACGRSLLAETYEDAYAGYSSHLMIRTHLLMSLILASSAVFSTVRGCTTATASGPTLAARFVQSPAVSLVCKQSLPQTFLMMLLSKWMTSSCLFQVC